MLKKIPITFPSSVFGPYIAQVTSVASPDGRRENSAVLCPSNGRMKSSLIVALVGVTANLAGGGFVLSLHSIRFDGSRMNPMKGIARLVDKQALVRLGIAVAKLTILGVVSWQVASEAIPRMIAMEGSGIETIGGVALDALLRLGVSITFPVAVVASVDFVVQRRRARSSIRMTKDEVKREMREQDGDPLLRSARRRRARQIAMQRMMQAVPTADVVVTNPTHLAVALKYDSLTMKAPRIVAKGQRLMAQRIKKLAKESGVPVIEDKPLARALFPRPLNSEIPAHLYAVVARLLVMVQQTRFGLRRTASRPAGTAPSMGGAAAYRPSNQRPRPATGDLA